MLKVNLKDGKLEFVILKESGLRFAMLAALFWGFSFGYSYYAVTFTGPALFAVLLEGIILVLAGIHILTLQFFFRTSTNQFRKNMGIFEDKAAPSLKAENGIETKEKGGLRFTRQWQQNWMVIMLIGVLGAIGTIFNTIALDKASINTVTGIVAVAPIISVIFGQAYYGEILTRQQKFAVLFIIAGIFIISYFRYY
jgi:drug/metabolite transporter (DMT)-like permease